MKKVFLGVAIFGLLLAIGLIINANSTSTKTTEYWEYNNETGKYELDRVEKEEIDGMFGEEAVVKTKIESELKPICEITMK